MIILNLAKMKNKKLQFDLKGFSLGFREKRLIFDDLPPEGVEAVRLSDEEVKANQLIEKICVVLPGKDKGILKDNPFKKDFVKFAAGVKDDFKAVDSSKNGQLLLVFDPLNSALNVTISGEAYAALFWKEIKVKMDDLFKVNKFPEGLYVFAGEKDFPAFTKLALILAEGKTPTQEEIDAAAKELEANRAKLREPGEAETARERGKIAMKREVKKERILAAREVETSELRDEMKKEVAAVMAYKIDKWKIAVIGRSNKIDATRWSSSLGSQDGLVALREEWKELEIYEEDTFFKGLFAQLAKASDEDFLQHRSDQEKIYYMDPTEHLEKLKSIDPAFAEAVSFFLAVRDVAMKQDTWRENLGKNVQEKNELTIAEETTKVVKANLLKFRDALRDRDYATAGVYVVGIFAMYKAYNLLPEGKRGTISKAFYWGAALGTAHLLAKNAGFDVLKKLGINSLDHDIKGTSLESLYHLRIPEMTNVNDHTVRDAALININSLYQKYLLTNKPGSHKFIDPALFPDSFKEFQGMSPAEIDQKGSLDLKQKNYEKTGQELYWLVVSMEKAYNKTLKAKYGKSFGEVIADDPTLSKSSVLDFATMMMNFANFGEDKQDITVSTEYSKKLRERFEPIFTNIGFGMDSVEIKEHPGAYYATIKGYPVVIRRDRDTKDYLIFDRGEFDKANGVVDKTTGILGKIPYEGDATPLVREIEMAIDGKMATLVSMFVTGSKDSITIATPNFENGFWFSELTYKRAKIHKGENVPVKVKIVSYDGNSLNIEHLNGSTLIHVQDVTDKANLHGSVALSQLVTQRETTVDGKSTTDFSPLMYFYKTGKLIFVDTNPDDHKFQIRIGNVKIEGKDSFEVEFDENTGTWKFTDDIPDLEEKLLKDHTFRKELGETLMEDKRMKEAMQSLSDLVEHTPEAYLVHFFSSIPNWFKNATLHYPLRGIELKNITGPIAKNYMRMLLQAKKEAFRSSLASALDNAGKFADVQNKVGQTIVPAISGLEKLASTFAGLNTENYKKGDKFSEEGFMADILKPLMEVGINGEDYKDWYTKFVDTTFTDFGLDDIRQGRAIKAADLVKVFSYYTAAIDNEDIDGANLSLLPADEKEKPDEYAKMLRYKKAAAYVNYVAGAISMRRGRTNNFEKEPVPNPTAWGLTSFKDFVPEVTAEAVVEGPKLVDTTERIRMTGDYIAFDDYLNAADTSGNGSNEDEKKDLRDKRRGDIILPRATAALKIKINTEDSKLFYELIGLAPGMPLDKIEKLDFEKRFEKMQKTKFEEKFIARWNAALTKLDERYSGTEALTEQRTKYTFKYNLHHDSSVKGPDFSGVIFEVPKENMLTEEMKRFEAKLGPLGKDRTITAEVQKQIIDARIREILEESIVCEEYFEIYFNAKTPWQQFKNTLGDFWFSLVH